MRNKFKFLRIQTPLRKSIIRPYIKEFKKLSYDNQISFSLVNIVNYNILH